MFNIRKIQHVPLSSRIFSQQVVPIREQKKEALLKENIGGKLKIASEITARRSTENKPLRHMPAQQGVITGDLKTVTCQLAASPGRRSGFQC